MTAEVVVKKRGRPKKAGKLSSSSDISADISSASTSKSTPKSRAFSTTDIVPNSATQKKATRRKKITTTDGDGTTSDEAPPATNTTKSSVSRKSLPKSSILDEATAFTEIKHMSNAQIEQGNAIPRPVLIPSDAQKAQMSTTSESVSRAPVLSETNFAVDSAQRRVQLSASDPGPTKKQSSFLSEFLSKSEPAPELTEDSKISDRSAFSTKAASIDEIVSGAGVSNLSTLEALSKAQPVRPSAISVAAPKSFKSYTLGAFPNTGQKIQQAKTQIDPTSYVTGSFSIFKTTQPPSMKSSIAQQSVPAARAAASTLQQISASIPTANPTVSRSLPSQQQQRMALLQTSSKPNPISSQPSTSTSSPSAPTPSQSPPSAIQPQRPHSKILQQSPFRNLPPAPQLGGTQQPPPFAGKRPTEMSPAELKKNPEFKALRRKWTGLIVGIPVLVTTSYVLWNRLERSASEDVSAEVRRERGVVPRILEESNE